MELPVKIIGKHRAFSIKGDSMPPLKDGSIVVGEEIASLSEIIDGETYVIVTKEDGIVYKRIYRDPGKRENVFILHSDNPLYPPYPVQADQMLEVWGFVCNLNIGEFEPQDLNVDNLIRFLQSFHIEMIK